MKIAVMAGTPVDTEIGFNEVVNYGYRDVIKISISENPEQQTIFQTSTKEYKEKIINKHILKLKKEEFNIIFVYCNSLSSSVDFSKFSKKYNIKIITPLEVYSEIAEKYNNLVVMAANAQGLSGIEKVLFTSNSKINIIGFTLLDMVKDIENKLPEHTIAKKHNFEFLGNYINSLNVELIVLGCTHFPYVEKQIKNYVKIPILNPTKKMLEKIDNNLS